MKKGFTLVELLAVIVILAVILAIAIPGISGVVSNATKSSLVSDAKLILKAVEYKMMEDSSFNPNTVNETNINDLLNISNENYNILTIKKMNGTLYITILGKSKWNNLTASGTKTLIKVSNSVAEFVSGANNPVLVDGMTPIKWDGTTWVDTTTDDTDWYNYDTTNKKWANAKTEDGSMWVWVPRYIYKISSGWHSSATGTIDIQFSKGVVDNWNKAVIGNIELDESAESSNNKWTNNPAFTFGSEEITGIWVAKFEATASEGVANGFTADGTCPITGDNVTTKTVKILPNSTSWRCVQVGTSFTAIRNMEANPVYGWPTASGLQANGIFTTDTNNIDTHLMKNIEWGAVAYLSKSSYGKNAEEIYINNNQNYIHLQ
jgi:type IV pilus assembly protein PilA